MADSRPPRSHRPRLAVTGVVLAAALVVSSLAMAIGPAAEEARAQTARSVIALAVPAGTNRVSDINNKGQVSTTTGRPFSGRLNAYVIDGRSGAITSLDMPSGSACAVTGSKVSLSENHAAAQVVQFYGNCGDDDRGFSSVVWGLDGRRVQEIGSVADTTDVNDAGHVAISPKAGINNNDVTVGSDLSESGRPERYLTVAFRWAADETPTELPTLPGATSCPGVFLTVSEALDINDSGVTVGYSIDGDCRPQAVRWAANGDLTQLAPLDGDVSATATEVNASGVAVGWSADGSDNHRPVWWDVDGTVNAIPLGEGFTSGEAFALNDHGDILGSMQGPDGEVDFVSTTNPGRFAFLRSYANVVLADHPVAYWRLDDQPGSTFAADSTGHGHALTVDPANATMGAAGLTNVGRSTGLHGGSSVKVSAGPAMTRSDPALSPDEFTVEWWQEGICNDGLGGAVDSGAFTITGADGSNCLAVTLSLADGPKTLALASPNALWGFPRYGRAGHHFVLTKSSTSGAALYIDGVEVAADPTATGAPVYGAEPFSVGSLSYPARYSSGRRVDDVAIYDYALPKARIVAHVGASVGAMTARTFGNEVSYSPDAGDPVDTYSGSLTHTKTDLSYPGFVYGMDLVRTYNSGDPTVSPLGLGAGWTTSLDVWLRPMADGSLRYHGPRGRQNILVPTGSASWSSPELIEGSVNRAADGTYALQYTSGERWEFDPAGRLVRKCQGVANGATTTGWCGTTAGGPFVTIAYDGPDGRPSTVTSSQGFVQRLSYDPDHDRRLASVVADDNGNAAAGDPTDRTVDFGYDAGDGSLRIVSAPHYPSDGSYPVELTLADAITGKVKTIKVRDVAEADDDAVLIEDSTFDPGTGRVVFQTVQSGDTVTFAYDDSAGTTTVTNGASGDVTVYHHDLDGRLVRQTDANGQDITKVWDAQSRTTDVADRVGTNFGYTYDISGRLTQKATPDPVTGWLPPRVDGVFPAPGPNDPWALETFTYLSGPGSVLGDQRLDTVTDAVGVVTHYDYDLAGHPESAIPVKISVGEGPNKITSYLALSDPNEGPNRVIGTQDGDGVTNCTYYNADGSVASELTILVASASDVLVTDATPVGSISSTLAATCANHRDDTSAAVGRTSYTYTALGQVATRLLPEQQGTNASWSYTYFGFGSLKSETDPLGNRTVYAYAPTGGIARVRDPLGKVSVTTYEWNRPGANCGAAGEGCSTVRTRGPRHGQFIDGVSGDQVDDITISYFDRSGDLREVRRPAAKLGDNRARTLFEYGPLGRLTKQRDPDGVVTLYAYDNNGNPTRTIRGNNAANDDAAETTLYDRLGRPTSVTTAKNNASKVSTSYYYNKANQVVATSTAAGTDAQIVATYSYDLGNGLLHTSTLVRNDAPHATGTPATVTRTYTSAGRIACVDTLTRAARNGAPERHTFVGTFYDDAGRVRLTTSPIRGVQAVSSCVDRTTAVTHAGRTYHQPDTRFWAVAATSYRRDGSVAGEQTPTQYIGYHPAQPYQAPGDDPHHQTAYGYDAAGRRTTASVPNPSDPSAAPATVTSCYTARGELAATIDPLGQATGYSYYDTPGLVRSVTDPLGMTFDPADGGCASAPTAGEAQRRGQTTFTYDGQQRRLSRSSWNDDLTAAVTERWSYTAAGRPLVYTDQLGQPTVTNYEINGGFLARTTTTTGTAATDSLGSVTINHLRSGNPLSIVSNRYGPDGTTVTGTHTVRFGYDEAGRRERIVENPGPDQQVTRFFYTSSSQVSRVAYPDGKVARYQYDLADRQTRITYPNGTVIGFTYDGGQRLTGARVLADGVWSPLATYGYNANGQRTTETLLGSAGTRTWSIDPRTGATTHYHELLDATTHEWDLAYRADGRLASDCTASATICDSATLPGSVVKTDYAYDGAGQLTGASATNAASGSPSAWAYEYGNRGNRTRQSVTVGAETTTTFSLYDDAAQLCAVKVAGAPSSCGDPSADRYGYDGAGRRTSVVPASGTGTMLRYDVRGRLQVVGPQEPSEGSVFEVRGYDGMGNLAGHAVVEGQELAHSTIAYWDLSGRGGVPQVLESTVDGVSASYAVGGGRISADGQWYRHDHLGSVLGTTSVAAPQGYDPFGTPSPAFASASEGARAYFGYRGEWNLGGFVHLRARDYDPVTATFLTRDPLDGEGGRTTITNPYAYGYNDPLNRTDPSGLRPKDTSRYEGQACNPDASYYYTWREREWLASGGEWACMPTAEEIEAQRKYTADHDRYWAHRVLEQQYGSCANYGVIVDGVCGVYYRYDSVDAVNDCLKGFLDIPGGMIQAASNPWDAITGTFSAVGSGRASVVDMLPVVGSGKQLFTADDAREFCNGAMGLTTDVVPLAAVAGKTGSKIIRAACSFSADTQVLMANGTTKPIAEVRVGDEVLATDPETGETGTREVIATLPHTDQLLTLRLSSGDVVTTEDHKYWNVTDHQWQESQHLDPGDRLLTADGDQVTVDGLDWATLHTDVAYDLTVDEFHTFYVDAGDEAVLVHNCGAAGPSQFKLTERPSGRASTRQIEELADSMRTNGWQGDPVEVFHINGENYVINGHHRVEAARQAGIDVQYRQISEAELHAYGYSGPQDVVLAWANR